LKTTSVSVVIPTYNRSCLLTQALDSVLGQTQPPQEVIVIDDGSRDDTRARVDPYRDRVRYIYQENQGVSAARNRGVREATGEVVAFLDSDDVWHPCKLQCQLQALADHPALALLGTGVIEWPGEFPDVPAPTAADLLPIPYRRLVVKNYFTTSSLLARREALARVGPFDTSMSGPEDYDLWLRVANIAPVAKLNLPLTGYRYVPGSLSSHAVRMEADMQRILRKLDERSAWEGDRSLRRKAHSYCDFSCAVMHADAGSRLRAVVHVLRSLARYPWPFERGEVRTPLARPKLLGVTLWRLLAHPALQELYRGTAAKEPGCQSPT
jgi:GT2 family glycosyltransferase